MVPPSALVVDVGSDHGYLALLLLKKHRAERVINVEKARGPLQAGIVNALKSKYADRIDHQLSDGFARYKGPKAVDTVVLAGFGGQAIVKVLGQTGVSWQHLVVQPANNAHLVRKLVQRNDWRIADETVVDDGHYYEIIVVSRQGASVTSEAEALFGPINLQRHEPSFVGLWQKRLEHLQNIAIKTENKRVAEEIVLIAAMLDETKEGGHQPLRPSSFAPTNPSRSDR